MKIRVLSPALDEISEAALWFESQRVGLGGEFWQAVYELLLRIEANPLGFGRSEFATFDVDFRFAVVRRFNYLIHFLVEAADVQVVAVAHASRKPGYWLRRAKK